MYITLLFELMHRMTREEMAMEEGMVEQVENIEDMRGHSVKEWVSMQGPRQEIKNRFKQFLRTFIDDSGVNVFREKIKQMCEMNKQSLIINYNILAAQEQVRNYYFIQLFQLRERSNIVFNNEDTQSGTQGS